MKLQEKAEKLSEQIFLGGPVEWFEIVGRLQLIALLREGLYPESKVLDIGCGCLRGGYWLIHFLDPECYFGIEPNQKMLEMGIQSFLEHDLLESKRPRFDNNPDFNFSVFKKRFDFFIARSIWTHASKTHIQTMLDSFLNTSKSNGIFLTSVYKKKRFLSRRRDYKGKKWVGRSHKSTTPGQAYHSFGWIEKECRQRNLMVSEIKEEGYNYGNQVWLRITKRQQ